MTGLGRSEVTGWLSSGTLTVTIWASFVEGDQSKYFSSPEEMVPSNSRKSLYRNGFLSTKMEKVSRSV